MKYLIALSAAVLLLHARPASAQSLTYTGGASAPVAFDPGAGISIHALAGDSQGNLVYLARGVFEGTSEQSRLIRRSVADNFASATTLYTYPTAVYGSFVTLAGTTAIFGDSFPLEQIRTLQTNDPASQTNSTSITNVTGNYTVAFQGPTPFLVADPTYSNAQVYQFNTSTGALKSVLNTQGDTTGPIAFDLAGNLFYGRSGADFGTFILPGNIFRFTAAEVAAALATDTPLTLTGRTPVITDAGNQFFALQGDTQLFQTRSDFGNPNQLNLFDLLTGGGTLIASTGGSGNQNFSGITFAGGQFYAAVTDFNAGHSLVFAVPEPGVISCLIWGGFSLLAFRRRL